LRQVKPESAAPTVKRVAPASAASTASTVTGIEQVAQSHPIDLTVSKGLALDLRCAPKVPLKSPNSQPIDLSNVKRRLTTPLPVIPETVLNDVLIPLAASPAPMPMYEDISDAVSNLYILHQK
jgi:hypothetical protein